MLEVLTYTAIGLTGVVGMTAYFGFSTYNRLIALNERCTTASADIDVLLKHRHSLIPGLVETVKGFTKHEASILNAVTSARAEALVADNSDVKMKSESNLTKTLNTLITTAEKYPQIQSSSHFRDLRNQLIEVENRITASRRFYNITVDEYNATLGQFPGNMLGTKLRMSRRNQYELGAERLLVDEPVSIQF